MTEAVPHYLVVEDLGDGEFNRTVEHQPECPTEVRDRGPLPGQVWEEHTCGVGYWESMFGFDDLKDDPRFTTPGRHEISFFYSRAEGYFEDAEAFLEYVG